MSVDISVIIPTYNESGNIALLLEKIQQVLSAHSYEIIVVDDNSPDRTWEVAQSWASSRPAVSVIRRMHDRGLSSAVITGMEIARGRSLAVMDADLQHDESILPIMAASVLAGECDVAIGSRGAAGGSYGEWSRRRRFISFVAATMARIVLPVQVTDPMSGFFVISRKVYQDTIATINPRGFKILLEFIGRSRSITIKEFGYTFRNRVHGETKLSGLVIKNYLVALYDLRFGKYVSPTFMLYAFVGLTGVFINMSGFALGEFLDFPHVASGITAIDPLFLSVPFGIQLSIISNYVLNNYLTFFEKRYRGTGNLTGFLLFQLISMLGLFVQFSVFQLLQGAELFLWLEDSRKFLNNGIGIIIATITNYYLNLNVTWKGR
ncbi:MAG: glycosyltransferase family 2 protein [Spirochaetales bacterium]|nr:glycosyltransferase family 2 protein [Spirochaetales bacterium]